MRALPIFPLLWCYACAAAPHVPTNTQHAHEAPLAAVAAGAGDEPAPEERVEPALAIAPALDPLLADAWQEDFGDDVSDGVLGGHLAAEQLGGSSDSDRSANNEHPDATDEPTTRPRWLWLLPSVVVDAAWTQQTAARTTVGPGRQAHQRTHSSHWLALVRLQWRSRRRQRRGWRAANRSTLRDVVATPYRRSRAPWSFQGLVVAGLCLGGVPQATGQSTSVNAFDAAEQDAAARALRERLAAEPTLRSVQQAALRFLGLDGNGVSVARVRASAWLPHVAQVNAGWSQAGGQRDDDTYTWTGPPDGAWNSLQWRALDRMDATTRHDVGIRLQWDLQALVWNDDELSVLAHQRRLDEARQRLLQLVAQTFHRRRRAMAALWLDWDADARTRLDREFEVDAVSAELDALTGGWYAQALVAALPANQRQPR